ncbi:unnamed protein product [Allacma fusca]|uniref:Tumor susceptibility gene 101 protein n=1 Tax=Allacma fusca TaxID=39272 RepID=A0A8J2KZ00_9HEXA|nr:unnamed protein product [Allacma fusca]
MADHESFVRQSLSSAKYRDAEKTRRETMEVLQHYRGLKPASEYFVFNNGTQKMLLNLCGTIPVNYKGATYNIPIVLWLLDTHPLNAPMVFVKPTADMRIKVSRHVDHTGKVYLPYLHDWNHVSSDLATLIQVLILTFGEQPPVYSVFSSPPPPISQPNVPYPTQSYNTPYPAMPSMPMPMPGLPAPGMGSNSQMPVFNIRPSLVTAAEEKLRRRLEDVYLSREIIKQTGDQLKAGQAKLEGLVQQMENEKVTVEQYIGTLENELETLDNKISKQQTEQDDTAIDDVITAPTPLYKQILNTFAEEAALEDTIYYLGEAFRREQLDLEQYLKNVRALSRRQFMHRALLQKCRLKAGLAG